MRTRLAVSVAAAIAISGVVVTADAREAAPPPGRTDVRATDRATSPNTDPTPAWRTWTLQPESTDTMPPVTPEANQTVAMGSGQCKPAGVNIARETNAMVVYRAPLSVTPTNMWGVEVSVVNGKVTAVNDREASASTTGTTVPAGGYVLSGHDQAADWLRTYARVGSTVTSTNAQTPVPTTPAPTTPVPSTPDPTTPASPVGTSAPMGLPDKVQAIYHMMWSNSGSPLLRDIPAQTNVINLAFLQGDPPSLVGWGSQGEAAFISDAKMLRARGVRIVASIGGADGHVNVANREAFVQGVMNLNAKLPLDGIDWDLEGAAMAPADIVWISMRLKQLRGNDFAITLAPNGSNIDEYRAIAVELQQNNALDMIGQQFYDAVVSKEAAKGRVAQLVSAGIPQAKIGIGMMIGTTDHYWTVDECIEAVRFIKASYPNIRGGYLWEAGRVGTSDWANRLAPIPKG